jgi:hypothetical protein
LRVASLAYSLTPKMAVIPKHRWTSTEPHSHTVQKTAPPLWCFYNRLCTFCSNFLSHWIQHHTEKSTEKSEKLRNLHIIVQHPVVLVNHLIRRGSLITAPQRTLRSAIRRSGETTTQEPRCNSTGWWHRATLQRPGEERRPYRQLHRSQLVSTLQIDV